MQFIKLKEIVFHSFLMRFEISLEQLLSGVTTFNVPNSDMIFFRFVSMMAHGTD
jgi:hypothetical protein